VHIKKYYNLAKTKLFPITRSLTGDGVKKTLNLPKAAEISMIIGCGIRTNKGVYGPRFRIPFDEVYFQM